MKANLKIVALLHGLILGLLLSYSWIRHFLTTAQAETIIPVEVFVMAQEEPLQVESFPEPLQHTPPAVPDEIPAPESLPDDSIVPEAVQETPPRKKIERSSTVVTRTITPDPGPQRKVTVDMQRILKDVKLTETSAQTPRNDERDVGIIYSTLYGAWQAPTKIEAGNATAMVVLHMAANGSINRWELAMPSGNPVFDKTVRMALDAVPRIAGLSPSFLQRNVRIEVTFRVE